MARKKKKRPAESSEVPISSMIDVVFLLLTFFIFTSKEVIEEAYVDLKPAGTPSKPTEPPKEDEQKVKIEVEVQQRFYKYANREYAIEALDQKIGRLAAVDPSMVSITMLTALDSKHDRLIQLLDICKKHEIDDFNILSKK